MGDGGLYQNNGYLFAYPQATSANPVISATSFNQVVITRTADREGP